MIGARNAEDFRRRCKCPPNLTYTAKMKKGLFLSLKNDDWSRIVAFRLIGINYIVKLPHECLHVR